MATGPFQPRILAALAAAFCTLFAASLLLTGLGSREATGLAAGANSYSTSAVGHLAFHDLLRESGNRVLRIEDRPLEAVGENGVLILAEPLVSLTNEDNRNKLRNARRILLVLPKWSVRPGERRKDWIDEAELLAPLRVQAALSAVASSGDIIRTKSANRYNKTIAAADPIVEGEVQLIKGSDLTPLIETPDGILLGELRQGNRRTLILADPDPIQNHGIGKGQNAAFARDIVAALRDDRRGGIVFDETIHGFRTSPPNLLKFLYDFPLNLVLVQLLVAVALLLWAAMGRFGAPLPGPRRLDAGRHALIGNAAALVDYAGHHAALLERYIAMTLQEAARALRAPAGLSDADLAAWLARASEARGIDPKPLATLGAMPAAGTRNLASLLAAAQALHHCARNCRMELRDVSTITEGLRGEIRKAVVGQDEVVELMLVSLLSGGHVLLEGVPGTAKTLLAQSFAAGLSLRFGRIQFTPDMMPGDLLGTNLFDFRTSSFNLTRGPIFTDILLADEINRTPPKTQAALLQAMNERNVTIDGTTHPLGEAFMVVATQNPIEQQGTYPLPEAQLDRFLFKIILGYPSRDEELAIVARHGHRAAMPKLAEFGLASVVSEQDLLAARALVAGIALGEPLVNYIVDLIRATRNHPAIETGASPRAATMLASAARARAATQGRDFIIPDDVKAIALPLLRHRVVLAPNAEIDGLVSDKIILELIDQVAVPR